MDRLSSFIDRLREERGDTIEFIVLFGSRARGDWLPTSDYDLLIGLVTDDGKRLVDRIADFAVEPDPGIEVFPYGRSEWKAMFRSYHPLFLEALRDGVLLWDRGSFAAMREEFAHWRLEGRVQPWRQGWRIRDATKP